MYCTPGFARVAAQARRFRVCTELRVRVSDEPRYRIPDICVKALPHEITSVLVRLDLAIEILSPDDEVPDMLAKVGDYLAAGIPHIWIVDPYKHTLAEADQAGIRRPTTLVLATPLVGEIDYISLRHGGGSGARIHTRFAPERLLRPLRLPISPFRHHCHSTNLPAWDHLNRR